LKIYSQDTYAGPGLGSGNGYQTNMNTERIGNYAKSLDVTVAEAVATVLSHEIWESTFLGEDHAQGDRYIDSKTGRVGGVFSDKGCEKIWKALGLN
jgi:hypothetical protein